MLLSIKRGVLVILPFVVKELLDRQLYLIAELLIVVELFQDVEEHVKFISFVQLLVEVLEFVEHINEVAHNIREDGHTKEHHEGDDETLGVALRMEIAKSHCRKGGEGIVQLNSEVLMVSHTVQVVASDEIDGLVVFVTGVRHIGCLSDHKHLHDC